MRYREGKALTRRPLVARFADSLSSIGDDR